MSATPKDSPPTPDWRALTLAQREAAYSPSSCIGGHYQPFVQAYATRSAQVRAAWPPAALAYGPKPSQTLDLFLPPQAREPAPLLVFIHGGYWQELSKAESSFAAANALAQGLAFAALDYTLAPAASVGEIVAECRQAVAHLQAQASALGLDPRRVVVAGSSAGAHLAAMVALAPAAGQPTLQGVVLVSGVFDLEPLVGTSINQALAMDASQASALSPLRYGLDAFPRCVVAWGEVETEAFKGQSQAFAARLHSAGVGCEAFEVPQRNHFDVVMDLAEPASRLSAVTLALFGTPPPTGP
jgi:arylformamidase